MTTTPPRPTTPDLGIPNAPAASLLASADDPGTVLAGWVEGDREGDLVGADEGTVKLLGSSDLAVILGLTKSAVTRMMERGRRGVPLPVADYVVGDLDAEDSKVILGWLPDRAEEIRSWYANPVAWQESAKKDQTPIRLLGYADLAVVFDVDIDTVRYWMSEPTKAAQADPPPAPDFVIGTGRPVPGWSSEREQEWRDWNSRRPGHGGRPAGSSPFGSY